jgi:hypothetical protein
LLTDDFRIADLQIADCGLPIGERAWSAPEHAGSEAGRAGAEQVDAHRIRRILTYNFGARRSVKWSMVSGQ